MEFSGLFGKTKTAPKKTNEGVYVATEKTLRRSATKIIMTARSCSFTRAVTVLAHILAARTGRITKGRARRGCNAVAQAAREPRGRAARGRQCCDGCNSRSSA